MTRNSLKADPARIVAAAPSSRHNDLARVSIGWTMLVSIGTLLTSAEPAPTGHLPWPASWIFYLPSLCGICLALSERSKQQDLKGSVLHALVGAVAAGYLAYTWEALGNLAPVALASSLTSLAHFGLLGLRSWRRSTTSPGRRFPV